MMNDIEADMLEKMLHAITVLTEESQAQAERIAVLESKHETTLALLNFANTDNAELRGRVVQLEERLGA